MAIAQRPQRSSLPSADIDLLIHRGGSPANGRKQSSAEKSAKKTTGVLVRIPAALLHAVDEDVEMRSTTGVAIPRSQWLLEAITEKLQRRRR